MCDLERRTLEQRVAHLLTFDHDPQPPPAEAETEGQSGQSLRQPGRETERAAVIAHAAEADVIAHRTWRCPGTSRPGSSSRSPRRAYGYSMASNYNRAGRPAVVAVRAAGSELWLRRETDEDLDRLEVVGA